MEYGPEDFTFWGQVGPQLFWLVVIGLVIFIRLWFIEDKAHLKERKQVDELLKRTSNKQVIKDNPINKN